MKYVNEQEFKDVVKLLNELISKTYTNNIPKRQIDKRV
jgi:hypothetical protein